ncbi:ATP-dependent DNA helicase DinG [Geomicrobium sp. JCM 19038]|uniref:ATP-dependent DNA helicase DinG n=1 Tax=Geomicrobium sp. JCM 19038 TaxID=1460635 RepID=UPI0006943927|nr:ATP-dependent DNA helicase DinG [Geomicrobium sp. JCM 19038]
MLDTVEMARMLYPTFESYRLQTLSDIFEFSHEQPHRAGSDAYVTAKLLIEMFTKLSALPRETVHRMKPYTEQMCNGLHRIIHEIDVYNFEQADRSLPNDVEIYRGFAIRKRQQHSESTQAASAQSFDAALFFGEEGLLSKTTRNYEERAGQSTMSTAVWKAMNNEEHLLCEAATGTGKTLAYLYPALMKSLEANRPTVIATETIALQQQIVDREIVKLNEALNEDINVAILKGRSHYLCLQKFEHFLDRMPSSYDEHLFAAQLLVWLVETIDGDIEELNLPSGGYTLWEELKSDSYTCSHAGCSYYNRCYYHRAKERAKHAQLIITNHSLLFTDRFSSSGILPKYDTVIFDEAHQMEDTAGKYLGYESNYQQLVRLISRFGLQDSDGLLFEIERSLKGKSITRYDMEWVRNRKQELYHLQSEWLQLFQTLQNIANKKPSATIHYRPSQYEGKFVMEVVERISYMIDTLQKEWLNCIAQLEDQHPEESTLWRKVSQLIDDFTDENETLRQLLVHEVEEHVYWMEAGKTNAFDRLTLYRRPISIASSMQSYFFDEVKSVIMTSATLTVKDSFSFIKNTLGLPKENVNELKVESPFSYAKQAQLLVPSDFPDIKQEEEYIDSLSEFISMLTSHVNGKMLVLFTSYDMLKKTYNQVKPQLEDLNYALLAQGVKGEQRTRLVKNFRKYERAILFGTSTFWEGIDLPGEDVRALIIVRLPFTPPNDPVYQAKANELTMRNENSFQKLAIPKAVLRFKQGFGRLIRTKDDRGLVYVLDKRLVEARYGNSFIRSLPEIPHTYTSTDEILSITSDFFEE